MGETRVDLQHLLEGLRDAYTVVLLTSPGDAALTIAHAAISHA